MFKTNSFSNPAGLAILSPLESIPPTPPKKAKKNHLWTPSEMTRPTGRLLCVTFMQIYFPARETDGVPSGTEADGPGDSERVHERKDFFIASSVVEGNYISSISFRHDASITPFPSAHLSICLCPHIRSRYVQYIRKKMGPN